MKKTAPKKTVTKKVTPKKTAPKSRVKRAASSEPTMFTFRRIIIIGGLVMLLGAVMLLPSKQAVTQSVAGVSIARPLFAKATVAWTPVSGAVAYNIYYKQVDDKEYGNAVRKLPASTTTYTISHLKKGEQYQYTIAAVNAEGKEFVWSPATAMTSLESM